MSDNLNRSKPYFSKYNSMSIEELEEILRADAMGSERNDSDVDEILYVMEVLAKKRRQNGIAGKTALEAYQEFQQHYLPNLEMEEDIVSVPKRKAILIPFRRIATIAASIALVLSLSINVNAFSWEDIWKAVAKWAEETFSISAYNVDINEPTPSDDIQYNSFQTVLIEGNIDPSIIPQWMPAEYKLVDIISDENPIQKTYLAIYSNDNTVLKISVQSYIRGYPEQMELSDAYSEIYAVDGMDCYLFTNTDQLRAAWIVDSYECYLSGEMSIETLKQMLDSIKKG